MLLSQEKELYLQSLFQKPHPWCIEITVVMEKKILKKEKRINWIIEKCFEYWFSVCNIFLTVHSLEKMYILKFQGIFEHCPFTFSTLIS